MSEPTLPNKILKIQVAAAVGIILFVFKIAVSITQQFTDIQNRVQNVEKAIDDNDLKSIPIIQIQIQQINKNLDETAESVKEIQKLLQDLSNNQ